jgi:hypothetical protein
MAADLIPFGKYKGQPAEALASDREYCAWLLAQAWFVQRYPQVHTLVINNFGEPSETPEHNALQIRLLDETFRAQCTEVALRFFCPERQWTHERFEGGKQHTMVLSTPYFAPPSAPDFEYAGIDALWAVQPWHITHVTHEDPPARFPERHQSYWDRDMHRYHRRRIAVECKPLIGDDYPAILRFLKNLPSKEFAGVSRVVLAGDVQSRTVPLAAIKQFFALSHILLVLVDEVEQVGEVPMLRESPPALDAHDLYVRTPGKRCARCLDVEGRQAPYVTPLTPQRFWEVFQPRAWNEQAWDSPLRLALSLHRCRLIALRDSVVHIGFLEMTGEDLSRVPIPCIDTLRQTLDNLMGPHMEFVLEGLKPEEGA